LFRTYFEQLRGNLAKIAKYANTLLFPCLQCGSCEGSGVKKSGQRLASDPVPKRRKRTAAA
jgi:hypothetical protein